MTVENEVGITFMSSTKDGNPPIDIKVRNVDTYMRRAPLA